MKEKTSRILLTLLRVVIVTSIMFFGLSLLLYHVFYGGGRFGGGIFVGGGVEYNETYFQILGRFFSFNWLETYIFSGGPSSREVFKSEIPGTRDLAIMSLLCGGIPGFIGGLRKKNEKKKNSLLHFMALGFIVPMGVFFSFLGVYTPVFPFGRLKSFGLGNPPYIIGSRLFDSLFSLNFIYFLDTLWHLTLPLICTSFVTFCLSLWISTKTKQDLPNSERKWHRINIRFLFAYLVFFMMILQANAVFSIDGIDDLFFDFIAFRDPSVVMIALFFLSRFIGAYFIFNCVTLIMSTQIKFQHRDSKVKNERSQDSFFRRKSNIVILSILGGFTLIFLIFFVLSLFPQFNLWGPTNFEVVIWGIRDFFMSSFEPFLVYSTISLSILLPIAYFRNQSQRPRQLNKTRTFFSQLGRDLLLLPFMVFCASGVVFSVVLNFFFGYFSRWASVIHVVLLSIPILLSVDIQKNENKKINLKKLVFRILSVICLIVFINLIISNTNGIRRTSVPIVHELLTFWEKLHISTPLAYLTTPEYVSLYPIIALISGILIWSFYLYWILAFILFTRLSKQQRVITIENPL